MKKINKSPDDRVMCVDGVSRYCSKCIGFCNNRIHKGFLTAKLLKSHGCNQKKCVFFDAIETHPYIIEQRKKKESKENKKKNKNKEKEIIQFVSEILPENVDVILCKHLYNSTFILVTHALSFNKNSDLSKKIYSKLNLYVYIKNIPKHLINNIEYTYMSFLPETMKEKAKRYKEKK